MYIYLITNKINNKKYVGKCERPVEKTKKYMGSGTNIKKAIKKYGLEFFTKEILEEGLTKENISEREKFWIKLLDTKSQYGYNLTDGGDCNTNFSLEVRKKISEKNKRFIGELNNRYGKKISDEHKETLRKVNIGKKLSQQTKEKISNTKCGSKLSETTKKKMRENRLGKPLSIETRLKMKNNSHNRIIVQKIDKKTKEILETYNSLHDASNDTGIKVSNISFCINGKLKSSGGFIWKKVGGY